MPDETTKTPPEPKSPAPKAPPVDVSEIINQIADAQNVLVALSSDPSVDELATAIGLSIFFDRLGKRATTIYSGATPAALNFLEPEKAFESTVDALQDFVIALNKEKADHLRYKLDGDFVKIYITPYRSRISEEDLEFSYGDFNIDLVISLDVANGIDLDSALREHGRIMHDAVIINITTGKPGHFGAIEWSDTKASSVAEMVATMLYKMPKSAAISKEEATAFLAGIVAATNRFANNHTTPETMRLASKLMESGANQQLVSANLTSDLDNELFSLSAATDNPESLEPTEDADPTSLEITHGEAGVELPSSTPPAADAEPGLIDELQSAAADLALAGAETVPSTSPEPSPEDSVAPADVPIATPEVPTPETTPVPDAASDATVPDATPDATVPDIPSDAPTPDAPVQDQAITAPKPELVITPPSGFSLSDPSTSANKYGQMLEQALGEPEPSDNAPTPDADIPALALPVSPAPEPSAMETAPIDGIPELNYLPLPGDGTLPPPPAPPLSFPPTA